MRPSSTAVASGACLVVLQLCNPAWAEEVGDIYGGISYSQTIAKVANRGTYKPTTLGLGLSVVAIPNLAVDGYVFTGVNDSSK